MAKTTMNLGLMLTALLFILACVVPMTPPPPGFVDTAIAGTYAAAAAETAKVLAGHVPSDTVTPTGTRRASATPIPTFTTVVLGAPEVRALVNASCRRGPGSLFEQVYLLRAGRLAELVGRSADGFYLIVRNPNRPDRFCWLESAKVEIVGFSVNIPVMTPPRPPTRTPLPTNTRRPPSTATLTPEPGIPTETPTATPFIQFDLLVGGVDDCPSSIPPTWWIEFEVGNTGDVSFESLLVSLTDSTAIPPTTLSFDSEDFIDRNGCGAPDTMGVLLPGLSHVVSAPNLDYNPAGHNFDVTVTLCTDNSLDGACVTRTLVFTIPP